LLREPQPPYTLRESVVADGFVKNSRNEVKGAPDLGPGLVQELNQTLAVEHFSWFFA